MSSCDIKPSIRSSLELPIMQGSAKARIFTFYGLSDGLEHIALQFGELGIAPLVRLHSECLTGDVFGSQRCDCGNQLGESISMLSQRSGLLLYLRQEGRGIGLYAKVDAYMLQLGGLNTFEANRSLGFSEDSRDYTCASQMLSALGVAQIRLITNNSDKVRQLIALGIAVPEVIPTGIYRNEHNIAYLEAKEKRSGVGTVATEGDRPVIANTSTGRPDTGLGRPGEAG